MKHSTLRKIFSLAMAVAVTVTVFSSATVYGATSSKSDPFGKYPSTITLSTVRGLTPSVTFLPGETIDNNAHTRLYKDQLNIKIKNLWVTQDSQYDQKVNVMIASGNIPDFFHVNATQFKTLIENEMVMDVGKIWDQYVSPFTKDWFTRGGGAAMKALNINGKQLGFQSDSAYIQNTSMLWIRSDWLTNLKLSPPKTQADVIKIATAFAKNDPDGNGKNDTYGLALNKDLFGVWYVMDGFMNSYHSYPTMWVKTSSGKLANGVIQPETKTALGKLAELYKAGIIDPEFGVKDIGKVAQDVAAGKIGMVYSFFANPLWGLNDSMNNTKGKADWKAYPIVSVDSNPAKVGMPFGVVGGYVINKSCKHPEAVIKLLNIVNKVMWSPQADVKTYSLDGKGTTIWAYPPVYGESATKNLDAGLAVQNAEKTGDTSKLNDEQKTYYNAAIAWRDKKDLTSWPNALIFGAESGRSGTEIEYYYQKNNLLQTDLYLALPTDTMTDKGPNLSKLTDETFTKIIMGQAPLSDFDKFVTQWNKIGGSAITKQVNDWYAKQKK